MNDLQNEVPAPNEKESVTSSASIHDVISDNDADEVYQVISNGFIETNQNSILRQNMTREEFDHERINNNVKKVILTKTENGEKIVIGYASIIVGQENIPWLDIQKMVDAKKIINNSFLCTIGTVVILPEHRSYENVEELLKVLGEYLSALNIDIVNQDMDFGVIFDCAPSNTELPALVDHLLNKHLGPTEVEKIGYTTSLFVQNSQSNSLNTVELKTVGDNNMRVTDKDSIFTSQFLKDNEINSIDIETEYIDFPDKIEEINKLIREVTSGDRKKSILIKIPFTPESIKEVFETHKNIRIEEQSIWLSKRKL